MLVGGAVLALLSGACDEFATELPGGSGAGPASIEIVSGNSQTAQVGSDLNQVLVVRVTTSGGAPVGSITVTWQVETGGGSVTGTSTTDSGGEAEATWTLGTTAGIQTVVAAVEGISAGAEFQATAEPGPPATLSITPGSVTLTSVGESQTLTAEVQDQYGNDVGGSVGWTSSNTAVATVSAGQVTAVANGTAEVQATSGSLSDRAGVTVDQAVARVENSPTSQTVPVGGSVTINATAYDALDNPVTDATFTWVSRNTSVATVNGAGLVGGVAQGVTWVVATAESESDSTEVTVDAAAAACAYPDGFLVGTVAVGQTANEVLTTGDCSNDGHYTDGYSLSLTSPALVQIDLESSEFDTFLQVGDDAGVFADNDDGGTGVNSQLTLDLAAGTYYVFATTFSAGATGSYSLTVTNVGSPDCTTPSEFVVGSISPGQSVTSTLSAADCLDSGSWYTEGWTLDLATNRTIQIDHESTDFDAYVWVSDGTNTIGTDNNTGGGTNARLTLDLAAGTYYVMASTNTSGRTGDYRLTVLGDSPDCGPIGDYVVGAITLNQSVDASLSSVDCAFSSGSHAEAWTFHLPTTTDVVIDQTSPDFDTYLYLYDGSVNLIAQDDDGGTDLNSRIATTLGAGDYYIMPSTFDAGVTGNYTLSVAGTNNSNCSTLDDYIVGSTTLNEPVYGVLAGDDCQFNDGSYAEGWRIDLAASTTVQIDMTSNEVNAYLWLYDAGVNLLAQNEDDGVGTNARITMTLGAGTYYVFANTSEVGETGGYTIEISN